MTGPVDAEIAFVTNTRNTPWLAHSQRALAETFPGSRRIVIDGTRNWPEVWFRWIGEVKRARERWVCLVDEDCFVCEREALRGVVASMVDADAAIAGVPDQFFFPRHFNELAMNPFFLVVDRPRMVEAMRRLPRWRSLRARDEWFDRVRYPWAPEIRRVATDYEPFYCFFWLFFEAGLRQLYLYPHEDKRFANEQDEWPATTVRLGPDAPDVCVHLWYSREWDSPPHRERYRRALAWLEAGRPPDWVAP